MSESPYVSAAKYAFCIAGGAAVAAAIVKGAMSVVRKGFKLVRPETQGIPTGEAIVADSARDSTEGV